MKAVAQKYDCRFENDSAISSMFKEQLNILLIDLRLSIINFKGLKNNCLVCTLRLSYYFTEWLEIKYLLRTIIYSTLPAEVLKIQLFFFLSYFSRWLILLGLLFNFIQKSDSDSAVGVSVKTLRVEILFHIFSFIFSE